MQSKSRMHNLQLDTDDFNRYQEIQDYAIRRGITLEHAIVELVNTGLSHLR